jgi:hypothetical protein
MWNLIVVSLGLAVLPLAIVAVWKRSRLPVGFKSYDEVNSVADVAIWAQAQVASGDPRFPTLLQLRLYLLDSGIRPPFIVRISAEDLEILAPFIDRFIAGEGPPWNLPAEYEDWRPAALTAFKERMKRERLWPQGPRPQRAGLG